MARNRDPVLDCLDARRRNIRHHITRTEIGAERTQPRDIDLQLRQPHRRRHIERGQRLGADDAIDGNAVPRLKAPHGARDIGVKNVGAGGIRIDIAGRGEAGAERRHARMAVAQPQHADRGYLRPAAACDNRRVTLDRLLGRLRRRRRNRGFRGFRHVDRAGRLVEALPERSALRIADQGIKRRVLRKGRARG